MGGPTIGWRVSSIPIYRLFKDSSKCHRVVENIRASNKHWAALQRTPPEIILIKQRLRQSPKDSNNFFLPYGWVAWRFITVLTRRPPLGLSSASSWHDSFVQRGKTSSSCLCCVSNRAVISKSPNRVEGVQRSLQVLVLRNEHKTSRSISSHNSFTVYG